MVISKHNGNCKTLWSIKMLELTQNGIANFKLIVFFKIKIIKYIQIFILKIFFSLNKFIIYNNILIKR